MIFIYLLLLGTNCISGVPLLNQSDVYSNEQLNQTNQALNNPDIITLTDSNFQTMVMDSEDLWLVNFYASWCPTYSQTFALEWAKVADELREWVKVGAYDATAYGTISQQYNIDTNVTGYPDIKVFASGKKSNNSVKNYIGGRTSFDFIVWTSLELNNPSIETSQKKVITLTDKNFKELVLDSQDPWLVNFYAEHDNLDSVEFIPDWAHVAFALRGTVKVGSMGAYQNWETFQKECENLVAPTIKMYGAGNKTALNIKTFNNLPRNAFYIYRWALENLTKNVTNTQSYGSLLRLLFDLFTDISVVDITKIYRWVVPYKAVNELDEELQDPKISITIEYK